MNTAIALLSVVVLIGLYLVPFALVAALLRGWLRGRSERAVRKRELESFD